MSVADTSLPRGKGSATWKDLMTRGFVFDNRDAWILRVLCLLFAIGGLVMWYSGDHSTHVGNLWAVPVALSVVMLTIEKRAGMWIGWALGILGVIILFIMGGHPRWLGEIDSYYAGREFYLSTPGLSSAGFFVFGVSLLAFGLSSVIQKEKMAAWILAGAYLFLCAALTFGGYGYASPFGTWFSAGAFVGIVFLLGFYGRRGAWWSPALRRLDLADARQRAQMKEEGRGRLPKDAIFLRFFSRFCLVAMGVVFVVALIVFFVPIERSYGWYERRYVTVTIFDSIKSVLSIFGEGDGLELRYWIAVAVNCLTLFAWSVYAKSVTNAAASHSQILAVTNRKAGASLGKLGVCASVWRVAGVIMGLISIVAAIKSFNLDLTTSVAIALCLCSLILGGTLAVFCWGLESIFAMQAWNEAAAQAIAGWVVMKSNATSEETISTRSTHVTANQRDEHLAHVATYRELAIGAGAEQACPELFSKADETMQKAKELAETENVDVFVFSETCAEAVTAYRMAIQQGAEAAAKWLEKTAYEALMEGHLDDALAAAEGALDWNPHSKMAAQIRFHVTMKKDSKILIAVLVGWAIVFFMCRGISAMAR